MLNARKSLRAQMGSGVVSVHMLTTVATDYSQDVDSPVSSHARNWDMDRVSVCESHYDTQKPFLTPRFEDSKESSSVGEAVR